jgi:preprotein translocase subunit SecG
MYTILLVTHTILVMFLIVMVLLQRSSADGLSGLGGGGGNQFLTGRASANLMTRTTAILAGAFMCTSLILAVMASRMTESSIVDSVPVETSVPVEPTVPVGDSLPIVKGTVEKKAETPKKTVPAAKAPVVPKPE